MALTIERVLGRDITVTTTGAVVTNWDTLSLLLPDEDFDVTSAAALYKQFMDGQYPQAVLSVSGFQGADDDPLPNNRDVVSAIDIAVGADSLIPEDLDHADRGIWKVKNPKLDWSAGAGKMGFEIKSGYLS